MYETPVNSSWIKGLGYVRAADGATMPDGTDGFLVVETHEGGKFAHAVPSWVPGLVMASKSKGRGYGKLVRGRFPSVRIN